MTGEKSRRGFAAMDPAKQRAIASKGGKAVHAQGKAHRFSQEEAAALGSAGGRKAHASGNAHQWTSETAAAAGRKGGLARRKKRGKKKSPPGNAAVVVENVNTAATVSKGEDS